MASSYEQMCSEYCRDNEIPIIGSALKNEGDKKFSGYILLEVGAITERKFLDSDSKIGDIAKIVKQSMDRKNSWYRFQTIISDDKYCMQEKIKVILYKPSQLSKFMYEKQEFDLPSSIVKKFIESVVDGDNIPIYDTYEVKNNFRDVLVCTHALRDKCCGKFGYPIYQYLHSSEKLNESRIWRSNHITGHRAAATMLSLPEGRYWGYLTPAIALKIASQEQLSEDEIIRHYRGLANLSANEQVAERELLKDYGYESNSLIKSIESSTNNDGVTVQINLIESEDPIKFNIKSQGLANVGLTKCAQLKPFKMLEINTQ